MSITRQTVLHIAQLARLELADHEVESLQADLGKIVDYVAELAAVDTHEVPPTAHMATADAARPDEPREGLTNEQALAAAPKSIQGGFAVPGFMDES